MKINTFLMAIMLVCVMVFTGCDLINPPEEEEEEEIIGVWELTGITTYNSAGALVTDDGPNPMVFPMDWVGMVASMGADPTNYDLDGDGDIEAVVFSMFAEVTDTRMRLYADMAVTDTGTTLTDYYDGLILAGYMAADENPLGMLPFLGTGIRYNSTDDAEYTTNGSTLTGLGDSDSTFVISGTTLTITLPEGTGTMVMVFSAATSSDLTGAVDDITMSIF